MASVQVFGRGVTSFHCRRSQRISFNGKNMLWAGHTCLKMSFHTEQDFGNITHGLVRVLEKIHLVRKLLVLPTDNLAACVRPEVYFVPLGGNINLTSYCNLTYRDWGLKLRAHFYEGCKATHSRLVLENSAMDWLGPSICQSLDWNVWSTREPMWCAPQVAFHLDLINYSLLPSPACST